MTTPVLPLLRAHPYVDGQPLSGDTVQILVQVFITQEISAIEQPPCSSSPCGVCSVVHWNGDEPDNQNSHYCHYQTAFLLPVFPCLQFPLSVVGLPYCVFLYFSPVTLFFPSFLFLSLFSFFFFSFSFPLSHYPFSPPLTPLSLPLTLSQPTHLLMALT